jgi:hypothetical protein
MSGLFGVLGVYWVGVATTFGMSTGVPAAFSIEPATLRQGDKDVTTVLATVTLQSPSPTFFVCALRSADKQKIDFATIIFRKGQTTGEAPGYVHWHSILKDVRLQHRRSRPATRVYRAAQTQTSRGNGTSVPPLRCRCARKP